MASVSVAAVVVSMIVAASVDALLLLGPLVSVIVKTGFV